jgi:hypothetical protein
MLLTDKILSVIFCDLHKLAYCEYSILLSSLLTPLGELERRYGVKCAKFILCDKFAHGNDVMKS